MPVNTYGLGLTLINGVERPGPTRPRGIAWPNLIEPGRSGCVCAPAPSVPPPRPGQRPRHSRCQYPIAPGSVGAPSATSVPHHARVSERAIQYPRYARLRLRRGGLRAQLVPQLKTTAGRVTTARTNEQTDRLGPDDSSERARWPRERAHGPHARATLCRRASGSLRRPATRTNGPGLHRTTSPPGPNPTRARISSSGGYGNGQ